MKNVMLALPFVVLASSYAFANDTSRTQSPAFSKGECSVAYLSTGTKSHAYKIIKLDTLAKLNQKQPKGTEGEICSKELKSDLKITADHCEVLCNPN